MRPLFSRQFDALFRSNQSAILKVLGAGAAVATIAGVMCNKFERENPEVTNLSPAAWAWILGGSFVGGMFIGILLCIKDRRIDQASAAPPTTPTAPVAQPSSSSSMAVVIVVTLIVFFVIFSGVLVYSVLFP